MWIFWILLIILVVLLFRSGSRRGSNGNTSESAQEILKKRFANGEISEEEYKQRSKVLQER